MHQTAQRKGSAAGDARPLGVRTQATTATIPFRIKEIKVSDIFDRTTIVGAARFFQNCVRNGDIEGALSSFHDDAVYVSQPGHFVKGRTEIRKALEFVCAMRPDLQAQRSVSFETGEIAAWLDEWTLKATTPDGVELDMSGTSSDIMQRLPNGNWVYLVDNPYGAAAVLDLPKDGL